MKQGLIVKGVGGSYEVSSDDGIFTCKAKGIFRNDRIKPLVGDKVEFEELPDGTGLITKLHDRTSVLIRPEVANATQAMLVFAVTDPKPSMNLADRFLINMEMSHVPAFIVFNKADLFTEDEIESYREVFKNTGYDVYFISAKCGIGIDALSERLNGNITVLAGPSGVGKSTLTNLLQDEDEMETGGLSEKIMRGKNTTRHSQLLKIKDGSYIIDTPGFTSFYVTNIDEKDLSLYYPEMKSFIGKCYYTGCVHINEPDCEVKAALSKGLISKTRYENYKLIYEDIKKQKKY